jgi:FRG domain
LISWQPDTTESDFYARSVLQAAIYLHVTFKNDRWLWRGQARHKTLSPGMHTRVLSGPRNGHNESTVAAATTAILARARAARLNEIDGVRLPDLALLAHLQHHGAATPLLDVSVDPLIALWMIAFASPEEPAAHDNKTGYLFGIRQPDGVLNTLDSRTYEQISAGIATESLLHWYRAPDVSERLRIQRGSFVLGRLDTSNPASQTIPIGEDDSSEPHWLARRLNLMGQRNPVKALTDAFVIPVRGASKRYLRELLATRCGLDVRTVYPTPWHRPFVEDFGTSYSRLTPVDTPAELEPNC